MEVGKQHWKNSSGSHVEGSFPQLEDVIADLKLYLIEKKPGKYNH
jgi:hypothetical protein